MYYHLDYVHEMYLSKINQLNSQLKQLKNECFYLKKNFETMENEIKKLRKKTVGSKLIQAFITHLIIMVAFATKAG